MTFLAAQQLMCSYQARNVSETVIIPMTEVELADKRRKEGVRIIYHRDRCWEEIRPGFYQPIHLMARLSAREATCPTPWSWGFRAALCDDDLAFANGSIPIHLMSNVENYTLQSIPQKRRTHVRKCHKQVQIVQLIGPALLQQQGYQVVCSSLKRTNHQKPPSEESYLASLKAYTSDKHRIVLAGLSGDKLGGYIDGYAVGETAYMVSGYYATEALPTSIVTGLTFEFVQLCRRSGKIKQIVDGMHSREVPSLCLPKEEMGFPVKHIPAKVEINSVIGKFIQWQRPHVYYRLTGNN